MHAQRTSLSGPKPPLDINARRQMWRCRDISLRSLCVAAFFACGLVGAVHADQLSDAETAYQHRDFPTALTVWQRLAEQGNPAAERGLGILYENGYAVGKDRTQAVALYRKAAAQGDAEAECRLGLGYVLGPRGPFGLPHDVSQGLALMTKAADQGLAHCQNEMGSLYQHGMWDVPKDMAQAVAWYRKAAEAGYAVSEVSLGNAYKFGEGVQQDENQAALWYQRAQVQYKKEADQGDVPAELALGMGYEIRYMDLPRDKTKALFWYQKAARQEGPLKSMAEKDVKRVESQSY
ncbi:hypothetical protein SAMN05443245_6415 [Paraburkholderia fungorum]|uniref:Sel1 repeat family protein n=1 Tax=Paraburkholderia fungorum TaxID=134537 RepID=A0A1H1JHD5_9BURK|nr:tetratricopeptide repeat protein [Paraburkholderia fungorum]SDR49451.1 hypothetical protein SAMN05443245_6415 [Paraburkholderia fungorum]